MTSRSNFRFFAEILFDTKDDSGIMVEITSKIRRGDESVSFSILHKLIQDEFGLEEEKFILSYLDSKTRKFFKMNNDFEITLSEILSNGLVILVFFKGLLQNTPKKNFVALKLTKKKTSARLGRERQKRLAVSQPIQ